MNTRNATQHTRVEITAVQAWNGVLTGAQPLFGHERHDLVVELLGEVPQTWRLVRSGVSFEVGEEPKLWADIEWTRNPAVEAAKAWIIEVQMFGDWYLLGEIAGQDCPEFGLTSKEAEAFRPYRFLDSADQAQAHADHFERKNPFLRARVVID